MVFCSKDHLAKAKAKAKSKFTVKINSGSEEFAVFIPTKDKGKCAGMVNVGFVTP